MIRTWAKRIAIALAVPITLVLALAGIEAGFGQPLGVFAGRKPTDLGVINGQFKACSWRPNCISSFADPANAQHYFAPLRYDLSDADAERVVAAMLVKLPNLRMVAQGGGYFRAEAVSPRLGFVDDVEVFVDPRVRAVYLRSASRLGIRDFGVNRARMEVFSASVQTTLMQPRKRVIIDMDQAGQTPPVTPAPATQSPAPQPAAPQPAPSASPAK
jgi:uncharacterized protein (DUF1499 family)